MKTSLKRRDNAKLKIPLFMKKYIKENGDLTFLKFKV